jgi:membrane protease YdiL (CAAX protease family)
VTIGTDPILAPPSPPPLPPPQAAEALASAPRWGFWGTCAWGVAALAAFYAAQLVAIIGVLLWRGIVEGLAAPADLPSPGSNAVVVSATTLTALPVTLLMLALAARLARIRFADYFALNPIGLRTVLLALACTLGYGALLDVVTYAIGHPMLSPFVVGLYQTARQSGTLWLVLLTVIVAAPITEEFLFRGFLFRGWARSRLGAVGAVALTSLIWAAMHVQYDWVGVTEIFGLGLLFGWWRQRSGSLLTTLMMHGAYGLAAMIQVAVLAG